MFARVLRALPSSVVAAVQTTRAVAVGASLVAPRAVSSGVPARFHAVLPSLRSRFLSSCGIRSIMGSSHSSVWSMPWRHNLSMMSTTMGRRGAKAVMSHSVAGLPQTTTTTTLQPSSHMPLLLLHQPRRAYAVLSPRGYGSVASSSGYGVRVVVRTLKTKKRQIKRMYRKKTKYKMKTKKGVVARFKLLKSGGIKYWKKGRRQKASSKTHKRVRQLKRPSVIRSGTMFKKLRRAMQF